MVCYLENHGKVLFYSTCFTLINSNTEKIKMKIVRSVRDIYVISRFQNFPGFEYRAKKRKEKTSPPESWSLPVSRYTVLSRLINPVLNIVRLFFR